MTSTALLVPLVLLSAVLHASWNAVVKAAHADRLTTQSLVIWTSVAAGAAVIPFVPAPAPESWPFIALSTVVHTLYYVFLLLAYRDGELSRVYPIARGTAPLLVALFATLLVGETLSLPQAVGVVLVSLGIVSLTFESGLPKGSERHSIIAALLTGLTITAYSLIDGMGVRRSGSPIGYIAWLFAIEGIPFGLGALILRGAPSLKAPAGDWAKAIAGGLIATVGYGIAVWAMGQAAFAGIVSLRETSVVFGAIIGAVFLGERFGPVRYLAAGLVAAGNLLLHLLR
jgi:drug/metabolite transporter (DMT)-like permease